jgi:hypothetical protein
MEVAVQGRHAYQAAGAGGLVVVDVDDPATPTRVGGYWAPGTTRRVKADGTRLYIARTVSGGGGCLANSRGRLDVLDVSDPVRPKLLGAYATAQEIKDFQIVDQRAHLLMKGEGLEMVDLRDPSRPASLGARAFADPTTLFICG